MKRVLLILLTPALILISLWAIADFLVLPRVAAWVKEKILEETKTGPVEVTIGKIRLQLIRPRAEVLDIEIKPRGELARTLLPIKIPAVQARIDLFEIILGRAEIAAVVVRGLEGGLHLDPLMESKEPAKPLPIKDIFEWSDKIPVRRLVVQDAKWILDSQEKKIDASIELKHALLINRGQQLRLNANLPRMAAQLGEVPPVEISSFLSLELNPRTLEIQEWRVRRGDISLGLRGLVEDVANLPLKPRLRLNADGQLPLSQIAEDIKRFQPDMDLPPLSGSVNLETDVVLTGTTQFESSIRVRTQQVQVENFKIGDAQLEGKLTQDSLEIQKIDIAHPAGLVELNNARMEFRQPYAVRALVKTDAFDLQALFKSMDLHQIPVELTLKASLPCDGTLSPFDLQCKGKASGNRLTVRSGMKADANMIVALQDMEVDGSVRITTRDVTFQSNLRIGSSRGTAEGAVDFNAGFKIDYKTPLVSFKDVENLANLKFEGSAAIEGHTRGNTDTATFELKMETKDFVFENFVLGDVGGKLQYRAGHLLFDDLELRKGRTQATGSMDLDLGGDIITGSFVSPTLDAADIADIFSRIWKMPLEIQSTGTAKMNFDGPLSLWKLNYDLEASLKSPRIQGDSFDSLQLVAKGQNGNLTIEKADLLKNDSVIRARGGISSDQQMNISLEATQLRLEESEFVTRIRNNIAGQFNMTGTVTGPIANPEFRAKGAFSDLILEEQEIPSSFFNLLISKQLLSCETNLFGNRIQGEVQIPLSEQKVPLRIRVKTTDWPFTNLLSFVGASSLQNEYKSSITADVDLSSESGRFDQINGRINIRNFSLQRADLALRNPLPIEILLNNGFITFKNAVAEGPSGSAIRFRGDNFRLDQLNVSVFGDADLRLLHMFVPFLDDLGGPFRLEATLGGSIDKPQILGNASIRNGFVRLKGFPHALEKLQTDVVFSQSRILVQDVRGQLADGTIRGGGSVQINGVRDIPVNIRIQGDNLNLNVPDRVRTHGNADLTFSGRWFPFVLSGVYNVDGGVVEMELGGSGTASTVRTSPYLPKILRQAQFDPVILDLQVNLDRGLAVRNSLMQGGISGRIQVKGPPQNPGLLGRITTSRGSRVMIRDREFELMTGSVAFNHSDEINPDLYMSAQTRVNEYDINVLIQGAAKNPAITMSSTPPLPEQEIVSLLALGITSQSQAQTAPQTERQAQQQLGYEALGLGLSQTGLQKGLHSTTGLDVRITSTYDSMRNISVPKLSFTRTLTDRLDAVYLRPVNSDSNAQEFRLQYQLNSNWSAIGSYEQKDSTEGAASRENTQKKESVFGLDLEFKREFK
ncbi:MAG: translocation/assembly module TamB [Bdellovibrionaceae bacterium]|nr:translocation/assembly module TamB [Pseudobdellovibrionaceae bacterium]